jgi:hypothetical protein
MICKFLRGGSHHADCLLAAHHFASCCAVDTVFFLVLQNTIIGFLREYCATISASLGMLARFVGQRDTLLVQ